MDHLPGARRIVPGRHRLSSSVPRGPQDQPSPLTRRIAVPKRGMAYSTIPSLAVSEIRKYPGSSKYAPGSTQTSSPARAAQTRSRRPSRAVIPASIRSSSGTACWKIELGNAYPVAIWARSSASRSPSRPGMSGGIAT